MTVRPARPLTLGTAQDKPVVVTPELLRTGIHIVGPSGSGKSRMLELLIRQQLAAGQGLCVLDPTGALYTRLARWCAARGLHRRRKLLFIDPNDADSAAGLQPLTLLPGETIAQRVDGVVGAVARAFNEDHRNTPLLKRMLRAILTVLIEHERPLTDALNFVLPERDRAALHLGAEAENPYVARIWQRLQNLRDEQLDDQLGSVGNRLSEFLLADRMRALFDGQRPAVSWQAAMDESHAVIVNLQPRQLSSDNTRLIGTLITNELLLAARARSNELADKHPFTCFIDEAPRFLNEDIEHAIDETRQKGLAYVAAHQRLSQLHTAGPSIYAGVMSIRNKIIFGGLPAADTAELAVELFHGQYDENEEVAPLRRPVVVDHELRRNRHERITHGVSLSRQASVTDSEGVSSGVQSGVQVPLDSLGILTGSFGDTVGQARGQQAAQARSAGQSDTTSEQQATGWAETAWPILEERPGAVRSFEAQMHRHATVLHELPQQTICVRLRGQQPMLVHVPYVGDPVARADRLPAFLEAAHDTAASALMPPLSAPDDEAIIDQPQTTDQFFE